MLKAIKETKLVNTLILITFTCGAAIFCSILLLGYLIIDALFSAK